MINARSEKVTEKPAFKQSARLAGDSYTQFRILRVEVG
jgi:hypothetical protein